LFLFPLFPATDRDDRVRKGKEIPTSFSFPRPPPFPRGLFLGFKNPPCTVARAALPLDTACRFFFPTFFLIAAPRGAPPDLFGCFLTDYRPQTYQCGVYPPSVDHFPLCSSPMVGWCDPVIPSPRVHSPPTLATTDAETSRKSPLFFLHFKRIPSHVKPYFFLDFLSASDPGPFPPCSMHCSRLRFFSAIRCDGMVPGFFSGQKVPSSSCRWC